MFKFKGKVTHCPNCNSINIKEQRNVFEPKIKYICTQCYTEIYYDSKNLNFHHFQLEYSH